MNSRYETKNHEAATVARLARRIRVALGHEPGDLLLTGGRVVNVFTGQVQPGNVIIADGWIAGVGPFHWDARQRVELAGQVLLPGLIDAHMHVESTLLMPAELARLLVPHGTTTVVADPHEIGNVLGVPGIELLIAASEDLPLDLYFMAPSCVPATEWEDAGAVLGPDEVRGLLEQDRILGLAEVMDFPGVLRGDLGVLQKIAAATGSTAQIDGHAPGMLGQDLVAYVAAGIRADHESSTAEEARQKAALGMLVQVREGSSARNLDTLLPLIIAGELGDWCLATDDSHPDDLVRTGHLDRLLQRVVNAGVSPAIAVRHATLIPARHYGLNDRGAVAPGYRADLVAVDDLTRCQVSLVIKNGVVVARDGSLIAQSVARQQHPLASANTVHLAPLDESAFQLALAHDECPVIGIVPDQITTYHERQRVARTDGQWRFDPQQDVALVASVERHRATGRVGLGLVRGFSLRRHGALGSSVGHDSHNLIIVGTDSRNMLVCARSLAETGGGFVVASDDAVQAQLPLPIAGLLSNESADTVCRQLHEVHRAAQSLGCSLHAPFATLSFLALPVIPELRITDRGLWDVRTQQLVAV